MKEGKWQGEYRITFTFRIFRFIENLIEQGIGISFLEVL